MRLVHHISNEVTRTISFVRAWTMEALIYCWVLVQIRRRSRDVNHYIYQAHCVPLFRLLSLHLLSPKAITSHIVHFDQSLLPPSLSLLLLWRSTCLSCRTPFGPAGNHFFFTFFLHDGRASDVWGHLSMVEHSRCSKSLVLLVRVEVCLWVNTFCSIHPQHSQFRPLTLAVYTTSTIVWAKSH